MSLPSVDVQTVTVSQSSFSSDCVSIAASFLEGCTDDYYFFQYDDDVYILLYGDLEISSSGCSSDSCHCVIIWRDESSVSHIESIPFSGSHTSDFVGMRDTGYVHGSVTGNSSLTVTDVTYSYFSAVSDVVDVSVSNDDYYLVYSSADNFPHLIEGVQNYAFAGFLLCFAVLAFKLGDRLFRRIY